MIVIERQFMKFNQVYLMFSLFIINVTRISLESQNVVELLMLQMKIEKNIAQ